MVLVLLLLLEHPWLKQLEEERFIWLIIPEGIQCYCAHHGRAGRAEGSWAHIVLAIRKQREKGKWAIQPQSSHPSTTPFNKGSPPKGSTTFPTVSPVRAQVFKHMTLWGSLPIQTTTEAKKVIMLLACSSQPSPIALCFCNVPWIHFFLTSFLSVEMVCLNVSLGVK